MAITSKVLVDVMVYGSFFVIVTGDGITVTSNVVVVPVVEVAVEMVVKVVVDVMVDLAIEAVVVVVVVVRVSVTE